MTESLDPTAFDLKSSGDSWTNPLQRRIYGHTAHGGFRLDMPFITEAAPNLFHGGCETGLVLPDQIMHVVSLYKWEEYTSNHSLKSDVTVEMYDSLDQGFDQVDALAAWVNVCRQTAPVLVHCQAGLNRSSLVVARALVLSGEYPTHKEAIAHMRASRTEAVLCNWEFERWLLSLDEK